MPKRNAAAVGGAPEERRLRGESQAIIINNTFEFDKNKRNHLLGYKQDEASIKKTFESLHFEVEVLRNLRGKQMITEIISWMQISDIDEADCSACFIMTHGKEGGGLLGEDMETVQLADIKKLFVENQNLIGKPKLFFIQACRGAVDPEAVKVDTGVDHAAIINKAKEADCFMLFPTTEDHVSFVDDNMGSIFIKNLCKVLDAYGGAYHLGDIATKVNELTSKECYPTTGKNGKESFIVEMPEVTHSMTYNLYLNDA